MCDVLGEIRCDHKWYFLENVQKLFDHGQVQMKPPHSPTQSTSASTSTASSPSTSTTATSVSRGVLLQHRESLPALPRDGAGLIRTVPTKKTFIHYPEGNSEDSQCALSEPGVSCSHSPPGLVPAAPPTCFVSIADAESAGTQADGSNAVSLADMGSQTVAGPNNLDVVMVYSENALRVAPSYPTELLCDSRRIVSMKLRNATDSGVAFKVKATQPKSCSVSPPSGVIAAGASSSIVISGGGSAFVPSRMPVLTTPAFDMAPLTPEQWRKKTDEDISELRLSFIERPEEMGT